MTCEKADVSTRDGVCPVYVFTSGSGVARRPAIIFYSDAGGIRPAVLGMAQRLADAGHVVLVPDLFYRYGAYGPFDPVEVFKGDFRAILGPLMATTNNDKAAEDTAALLSYLDTRSDIDAKHIGALGFCMGGGMAISAAGVHASRISAVASFHGGNLANDTPASPHLHAPQLKAEVYIAAAEHDSSYPPEMAERLRRAFDDAGVRYRSETYDASHGWMKPDFPVYDAAEAERGWSNMLAFFERTLSREA